MNIRDSVTTTTGTIANPEDASDSNFELLDTDISDFLQNTGDLTIQAIDLADADLRVRPGSVLSWTSPNDLTLIATDRFRMIDTPGSTISATQGSLSIRSTDVLDVQDSSSITANGINFSSGDLRLRVRDSTVTSTAALQFTADGDLSNIRVRRSTVSASGALGFTSVGLVNEILVRSSTVSSATSITMTSDENLEIDGGSSVTALGNIVLESLSNDIEITDDSDVQSSNGIVRVRARCDIEIDGSEVITNTGNIRFRNGPNGSGPPPCTDSPDITVTNDSTVMSTSGNIFMRSRSDIFVDDSGSVATTHGNIRFVTITGDPTIGDGSVSTISGDIDILSLDDIRLTNGARVTSETGALFLGALDELDVDDFVEVSSVSGPVALAAFRVRVQDGGVVMSQFGPVTVSAFFRIVVREGTISSVNNDVVLQAANIRLRMRAKVSTERGTIFIRGPLVEIADGDCVVDARPNGSVIINTDVPFDEPDPLGATICVPCGRLIINGDQKQTDTELPVITCPDNITVRSSSSTRVTFSPVATDNCPVTVVTNPLSGSVFSSGVTLVTAVATDLAGNTATCTFTVTVLSSSSGPGPGPAPAPDPGPPACPIEDRCRTSAFGGGYFRHICLIPQPWARFTCIVNGCIPDGKTWPIGFCGLI